MKSGLHPQTNSINIRCVCGFSIESSSTKKNLDADICSNCHPYWSGTQKFVDEAGRIEKFERKFKKAKK